MAHAARRLSLPMLAGLAASGCVWIHPSEPRRDLPSSLAVPRFEEVAVDFAQRWDRKTSHHLTGAAVRDVDGDGREEIFVGGGAAQPNALLAAGTGADFYPVARAETPAYSNSPVIADLDGDGRPDLFWLNNDSPSRAYLKRSDGNRVTVVMPDAVSALGARVHLEGEGARHTLEVASAPGLGADQSPDLVFGLGMAPRAERLVISWADGRVTLIEDPQVNRPFRIEAPGARAEDALR